MKTNLEIDRAKEDLRRLLRTYLAGKGVNPNGNGLFNCINPAHPDNDPSCGIVPGSDDKVFHCFACGAAGDIFTAAHFIEHKPLIGRGFIADTLVYLAQKLGVPLPEVGAPTEEELFVWDTYTAYNHAALILRQSALSDRVKARMAELCWDSDVCSKVGVGSVTSYDDYLRRMTSQYGHKVEFLRKVDLLNEKIFNENRLVFIVRNENGAPVGFASRDLLYAEKKQAWELEAGELKLKLNAEGIFEGTDAYRQALKDLTDRRPSKFINTHDRCPIYSKGELLYNFDVAKRSAPPLYVFEGYGDAVTLYAGGLLNASAIGATAFTRDHLEMILNTGIKHIIFVLDADEAGEKGTERFVKMLEDVMAGRVGLRVEIIVLPEGSDDPDNYIRQFPTLRAGVNAFRQLPKMDMFAWRIRKAVRDGEDPLHLAEKTIPMIVNETNNLTRMSMTRKLSEQTGLDEAGLWMEVRRQVDADQSAIEEEKAQIARQLSKELDHNPAAVHSIIESARIRIENVEKRRIGYDPRNIMAALDETFTRAEKNNKAYELLSRFPELNQAIGGVPREQKFISVPGKPNQGKTTFLQNLAWDLTESNDDVICVVHTCDDAMGDAVPRILSSKFQYPSDYFKKPAFWLDNCQESEFYHDFPRIYPQAQEWLKDLVGEEKLIIADIGVLPASLPAMENWVRTLRNKYSQKSIVWFGDNFHLYDLPGREPGEGKIRDMSAFIKRVCTEYHITSIFSMELPKESLRAGVRPRISKIKGSSGMAYDANANFGIYNDLKDMGERATIFWTEGTERVIGPDGSELHRPRRLPVIELVIDKSKLSGFDGTIYYKLSPGTGRLEECNDREQREYRDKAANYHNSSAGQQAFAGPQAAFSSHV
jgi:DNA primase